MIKKVVVMLLLMASAAAYAEEASRSEVDECREEAITAGMIDPNDMQDYIDQCVEDYRAQKEPMDEESSNTYPDDM